VLQRQQIKILITHLRLIFTMARMLSNHLLFINLYCSMLESILDVPIHVRAVDAVRFKKK